jgi:RNA polymerase sigma-70 factor (ECF subfamily)
LGNYKAVTLLSTEELIEHIKGCGLNNRMSQKVIFSSYYGYAMSVCLRYTSKKEDAAEILSDGFLKVFKELYRFTPTYADVKSSFAAWLRKIMIYTAIDHLRKTHKYEMNFSFQEADVEVADLDENALDRMSHAEIMAAIGKLSPSYRTILNLFVVEGFSHNEIAESLGISVGTSKSNLFKAKKQLQKILLNSHQTVYIKNEV